MTSQSVPSLPSGFTRRAALARLGAGGLAMALAARSHGAFAQEATPPVGPDLPSAVQEFIAGWETLDVERIVDAFAADAVLDDVAAGVVRAGQAAIHEHVTALIAAFDELRVQVFAAVAAGDVAVLEWTLTGRYTGILPGLPPGEGQPVAIRGTHTCELANGRIQLAREYSDLDGLPRQLGLIPPMAGYVGWVDETEALISIVVDRTEVRAYACDGQDDAVSISEWFQGSIDEGEIQLTSNSEQAELTATVTPAAVTGTIALADQVHAFNLLPARYRAGLYAFRGDGTETIQARNRTGAQAARAKLPAAGRRVGPPDYTGGWIILNSTGEVHQRGALTEDGIPQANTTLNVATRLATLPDVGQVLTGLVTSTNLSRALIYVWP